MRDLPGLVPKASLPAASEPWTPQGHKALSLELATEKLAVAAAAAGVQCVPVTQMRGMAPGVEAKVTLPMYGWLVRWGTASASVPPGLAVSWAGKMLGVVMLHLGALLRSLPAYPGARQTEETRESCWSYELAALSAGTFAPAPRPRPRRRQRRRRQWGP
mmetsp:Transcript_130496/g.309596  ORF Transcript_130496/g.309596 Transcript_130496/m.309596 type:complete len:160 (-) Transcript_130496:895-1374(-)